MLSPLYIIIINNNNNNIIYIAKEMVPIQVVEREGFKQLVNTLDPIYIYIYIYIYIHTYSAWSEIVQRNCSAQPV